jgi:hypothetical protein
MLRRRMLMFAIAAALIPFQSHSFGEDESFVIVRMVSPLDCSPFELLEKEVPEMNLVQEFTFETKNPSFASTEREVLHDGLEYG